MKTQFSTPPHGKPSIDHGSKRPRSLGKDDGISLHLYCMYLFLNYITKRDNAFPWVSAYISGLKYGVTYMELPHTKGHTSNP